MKSSGRYYVYIMTNKRNTVLYTGVTNCLARRIIQHKRKIHKRSFTSRYNINRLVYYEKYNSVENAIQREKQIKAGTRKNRIDLINQCNREWRNLFQDYLL